MSAGRGIEQTLRLRGMFKFRNVELFHTKHRLHRLRLFDEIGEAHGHNLPGQTKPVLKPPALPLTASGGELRPVVIHFLLRIAPDGKRDRFGEFEYRAAVERR
jgi:hypothetical protein